MVERETADELAKSRQPKTAHGQSKVQPVSPSTSADSTEEASRAADIEVLVRRLAGKPADDILSRISDGDLLRIYPLCARRIRERYFVIDADRVFERALALVAVGITVEIEKKKCATMEWQVEIVDRAISLTLDQDREEEASGLPANDPEKHFRLFVEAFFREPALARTAAVRLNGLDERVRKGFYMLLLDGLPVENCLAAGLGPPERLQHDILIALQAVGLLDDAGVEELRWKGDKP
jgi:hypothetical protein